MHLRVLLLGSAALLSLPAAAQEDTGTAPQEIAGIGEATANAIAEADREGAQIVEDAGLVTSLPDWRREDLYLDEPRDMARWAPNMVAVGTPGFGSGQMLTLRGLGDVGVYVDGIRLGEETARHFGHFDIERVDIVRGPAPTLFGFPASGGAVNVALHRPQGRPYGEFGLSYGRFDHWRARASFDMSAEEGRVGLNFGGYFEDSDGDTVSLATGERLNEDDRYGGRVALAVMPSDAFRLDLSAAFLRDESLNVFSRDCEDQPDPCDTRFSLTGLPQAPTSLIDPIGGLPIAGDKAFFGLGNQVDIFLATGHLTWASPLGELSVVAGMADTDQDFAVDHADGRNARTFADPTPAGTGFALGGDLSLGETTRSERSLDARLTLPPLAQGLALTIGGTLHSRDEMDDLARVVTTDAGAGPVSVLARDFVAEEEASGYSLYGIAALTSGALELSLSGRFGEDTVSLTQVLAAGGSASVGTSYDFWAAEAAGRFGIADGATLIARAARGSGLADYDADAVAALGTAVGAPPVNWTFEGGIEASLFAGAAQVRLVGFHVIADDMPLVYSPGATLLTADMADLRSTGAEAELRFVPLRGLDVSLSAGFQDARYEQTAAVSSQLALCGQQISGSLPLTACGNGVVTPTGELAEPRFAPDLTVRGRASYDIYIPYSESFVTPSIGIDYRSDMQTGLANVTLFEGGDFVGGSLAEGRLLVNAGVALRTDDDWWLLSVECENCFDEHYVDASRGYYSYLGDPMTWTISARRKF